MNARLRVVVLASLLLTACGGAAVGAPTVAAPALDPRPPLVELVGPEASLLAWLHMESLRASPRYETVVSLFDRALPDDYPSRDYAHGFADRTEVALLSLVDRGDRRGDFLYLFRGEYVPQDLDGLAGTESPFAEEVYHGVRIRHRGEIGAALIADHTWLFGTVVLVRDALDRYEGASPRGAAEPTLLAMAERLGVEGATLGVVARPTESVVALLWQEVPERAELLAQLSVGGVAVNLDGGLALRSVLVARGPEVAAALRDRIEGDLARYRRHPAIFALGLGSAASEIQVSADGTDLRVEGGLTSDQLDTVLRRLRLVGMVQ